ncbi:MAG: TIGR03943 family protein [Microbacterium sp.]|uniref:TIGR03943 family putative permease subunit n=1 Tax=Microbacterium sp. TaxID=51671 RepID=UPI0039E3FCED
MSRSQSLLTRWLGVGLAACLAAVTVALAVTGRIGLYINPDAAWFAVLMAVVALVGTLLSFALPLGAEADHGHDHAPVPHAPHRDEQVRLRQDVATGHDAGHLHGDGHAPSAVARVAVATGGVLASGIVLGMLVLPAASLSAQLAASRDTGAAPLFSGSDAITLATTGDTASFGVGDWASVFATATNPDAFEGDAVTLTGFVSQAGSGDFSLTRLVITHCVIDAQPATVTVAADAAGLGAGQWVTISGTVRTGDDGTLEILASLVTPIDEPSDPYEY